MQKWEYMTVEVIIDQKGDKRVVYINDQVQGKMAGRLIKYPSGEEAELFLKMLKQWGQEGWEVVEFIQIQNSTDRSYLFKRPIPE
jgi:hypothetical protein